MKHLSFPQLMAMIAALDGNDEFVLFLENSSWQYRSFWKYLLNTPSYNDKMNERRDAFVPVFGKIAYDPNLTRKLSLGMKELMAAFITLKQGENSALGQLMIARYFQKQELFEEMDTAYDRALELARTEEDAVRHFVKSSIYRERYLDGGKALDAMRSKLESDNLRLAERLTFVIHDLTYHHIKGWEIDERLQQEAADLFRLLPETLTPFIDIQVKAVRYFLKRDMERYEAFKTAYFEQETALRVGRDFLLVYLINAVNLFPNPGVEIRRELIPLYRFGVEEDLLLERGEITVQRFNNVIHAAQSLGEYKLIRLAQEKLTPFIKNKKNKERCTKLANAYCHFGDKEYEKALTILKQMDKDTHLPYIMVLRKYVLAFKCFYENEIDKQEVVVYMKEKHHSFTTRLDNYVGKFIKKADRASFRHFFKLLLAIASQDKTSNQLLETLDSFEGIVVELRWLKEKIMELEK